MEHEFFENDYVARFLNAHFVSITVGREEQPDLDEIYMKATQILSGHGGWPMSVFFTPERKPFYAGTYFPLHFGDRQRAGFFFTADDHEELVARPRYLEEVA